MKCENCKRAIMSVDLSSLVFIEPCCHIFCMPCIKSYIEDQYVAQKGSLKCLKCEKIIMDHQIREAVGVIEFEKMNSEMLRELVDLVVCCKCGQEFEFAAGNYQDAPKKDDTGKKVIKKYAEHYA